MFTVALTLGTMGEFRESTPVPRPLANASGNIHKFKTVVAIHTCWCNICNTTPWEITPIWK